MGSVGHVHVTTRLPQNRALCGGPFSIVRPCIRLESEPVTTLAHTIMSLSRLPPEICDYIIDLLHNQQEVLKDCCLVCKSFVP